MKVKPQTQVLASRPGDAFVGRTAEIERIRAFATDADSGCLSVLAEPHCGASELLRQVYDKLFLTQTKVIPFYFEIRKSDAGIRAVAARFAHEFLMQAVAHRRQDAALLRQAPSPEEIVRRSATVDAAWLDEAVEAFGQGHELKGRAFTRNCLGIPLRAVGRGNRVAILIDGLDRHSIFEGGESLLEDIEAIAFETTVVCAGHRRYLFGKLRGQSMRLENLDLTEAGRLCENLAVAHDLAINDETRDLISIQLNGSPRDITSLFEAAADNNSALDTFEKVQQLYSDEIFGGSLGRNVDEDLTRAIEGPSRRESLLRVLAEGPVSRTFLKDRHQINDDELVRLHAVEIINIEGSRVSLNAARSVVNDHISASARLLSGERRALVFGRTLIENVRKAPGIMAAAYRRNAALDLGQLLFALSGKAVPIAALDYGEFKKELKGKERPQILEALAGAERTERFSRISYCANAEFFDPELATLADLSRAVVGMGVDADGEYFAIIAAEFRSKLEAKKEAAELWFDRLETMADSCAFVNYKIWLIASEGFQDDALRLLAKRGAIVSSGMQAGVLAEFLEVPTRQVKPVEEYEIVLPMTDDTELISARVVDDIATKHGLSSRAINQIKTALVEACINAAEHSLSPDRKIYQRFTIEKGDLVITVSNRGLRLRDNKLKEVSPTEGRRGWGLKLMQGLMDDVRIEDTDDGTRVTLIKHIGNGGE